MGLKKKTGELFHRVEDKNAVAYTVKRISRASILNTVKERGLEVLYLAVLFIFSAGIVNGLIEGTNPIVQTYMIFPQRGVQTMTETLIYLFIMLTGSAGMYLLHMGGRQSLRRRISDFYIILGFSVVLIALVFSLYVFVIKG